MVGIISQQSQSFSKPPEHFCRDIMERIRQKSSKIGVSSKSVAASGSHHYGNEK